MPRSRARCLSHSFDLSLLAEVPFCHGKPNTSPSHRPPTPLPPPPPPRHPCTQVQAGASGHAAGLEQPDPNGHGAVAEPPAHEKPRGLGGQGGGGERRHGGPQPQVASVDASEPAAAPRLRGPNRGGPSGVGSQRRAARLPQTARLLQTPFGGAGGHGRALFLLLLLHSPREWFQ
jgi:hypothetical protein